MSANHTSSRVVIMWTAFTVALAFTYPAAGASGLEADVFARVGERIITAQQFSHALRDGVRRKYYHGKVPEVEMAAFQREVAESLIERMLLIEEAGRRGMEPDPAWVSARVENIERRYGNRPKWEQNREQVLARARAELESESRVRNLEASVRAQVKVPGEAQLRSWYEAHPEKFTEPERFRVSAILLKVDPSSPTAVWMAAHAEATELVSKLRGGADFAELARLHSGDSSAEQGGDMGYLHRGMLGAPAQKAVDAAEPGEITEPVRLLEGVAIFRVDDRPPRQLRAFDEVRERVVDLWLRERRDQTWTELLDRLREQSQIQVNTRHYLPLPGS